MLPLPSLSSAQSTTARADLSTQLAVAVGGGAMTSGPSAWEIVAGVAAFAAILGVGLYLWRRA